MHNHNISWYMKNAWKNHKLELKYKGLRNMEMKPIRQIYWFLTRIQIWSLQSPSKAILNIIEGHKEFYHAKKI